MSWSRKKEEINEMPFLGLRLFLRLNMRVINGSTSGHFVFKLQWFWQSLVRQWPTLIERLNGKIYDRFADRFTWWTRAHDGWRNISHFRFEIHFSFPFFIHFRENVIGNYSTFMWMCMQYGNLLAFVRCWCFEDMFYVSLDDVNRSYLIFISSLLTWHLRFS